VYNAPVMETGSIALKEWAVIVEALATGRQIFLLRKGGIRDDRGAFRLEQSAFLFYPTFEHQQAEMIRPEFRQLFERELSGPADPNRVTLGLFGETAFVAEVRRPEALVGLERFHVWTPEFFVKRMAYRPQAPTLVVGLRLFRLGRPALHPVDPAYAGCKSWVPLTAPVPIGERERVGVAAEADAALKELRRKLSSS